MKKPTPSEAKAGAKPYTMAERLFIGGVLLTIAVVFIFGGIYG